MRARRGLSSVVGMVFAIIALTSVITYVSYSMNTLNQYNQSVLSKEQQVTSQAVEKFQVSNFNLPNNKLNVTITNTGAIPVNITKIWIQNTTAFGQGIDWTTSYAPSNEVVGPGATLTNIGQSIPNTINPLLAYQVKLVTSRGNAQQFNISPPSNAPILLQLVASPNTVPSGLTTTILLVVTNNLANNAVLTNISPNALGTISNTGVTSNCGNPTPSSYASVPVGTTVIFQWSCTETGVAGAAITYNGTLQNGYNHNYASSAVTIGNVQFASQSTSSLSASGLSVNTQLADNILLFDQNTYSVPYSGYQMYNTQTDNSTNWFPTFSSTGNGLSFYTNNGTALTISPGKWNATLRYVSAPVPSTFTSSNQYPTAAYHFADYDANTRTIFYAGSSFGLNNGNWYGNLTSASATLPVWSSSSGVNNTGGWTFTSSKSEYLKGSVVSGYNDVNYGGNPTSTSMWFQTSSGTSCATPCTLLRIGDSNSGPYYLVYINSANDLVFKFSDHSGGTVDTTCTGGTNVNNNKWHFVVVEITGSTSCKIYTDGSLDASSSTGTACTTGHSGDCQSIGGHFEIGGDQAVNSNFFNGIITQVMHWDNYDVSSSGSPSQIYDLLHTSYGANAETVTFNIFEPNYEGTCTSGNGGLGGNCNQIISQSLSTSIPFLDGWGTYQNPQANSFWGHYNYTVNLTNSPAVTFNSTQRLEFQMSYVAPSHGILPMTMIIDNTGLTDSWGQSLLQVPPVTAPFMGYLEYLANTCNGNQGRNSNDDYDNLDGQVYIYNSGPNIAWITPNSRAIFTPISTPTSAYAGWMYFVTSGGYGYHQIGQAESDSLDLQVGIPTAVSYSTPYSQPGLDLEQTQNGFQGTLIPAGNYKMYIYVNGYDDQGHTLLTTEYLGPVRVYYTDTNCN